MNLAISTHAEPPADPTTVGPATVGLATALRIGTSAAHRDAERGSFVHALIRGQLPRSTYLDYLRGLQAIYIALETALETARGSHDTLDLVGPELLRAPAIARDLRNLGAADLATDLATNLATDLAANLAADRAADLPAIAPARAYADRLRDLADRDPTLLIAHAYTRYLGDLSGGQLLRRGAARCLGLTATPGTPGLEFYDFPAIPDLDAYKRQFRARLDALPLRPDQAAAVVDEARRAFADTAALFNALAPAP